MEQAAQVSVPLAPHAQLRVPAPPGPPQVPVQSAVQVMLGKQATGPVPPSPAVGPPPPQPVQVSLPLAPQVQVSVPPAAPGQVPVQSAVQVMLRKQAAGPVPPSPVPPPVEQDAQVSRPFAPHVQSRVPVPLGPQVAVQSAVQVMPLPQACGAAASACGGVVVLPPVTVVLPPVTIVLPPLEVAPPLNPPVSIVDPPVLVAMEPPLPLVVPPADCPALAAPSLLGEMPLEPQPIPITPKIIADTDRTPHVPDWVRFIDAPCGESCKFKTIRGAPLARPSIIRARAAPRYGPF